MRSSWGLLKRIMKRGRPHAPVFMLQTAIGLAMVPVEFYALILSRRLIDKGFLLRNWDAVKGVLVVLILIFLVRSGLSYGMGLIRARVQFRMNREFQGVFFSHLLVLPMRFFSGQSTGQLISRALNDANRFSGVFALLFGRAILDPITALGLVVILGYFSVRLCLLMVIASVFSLVMIHWTGIRYHLVSKEIQKKNEEIYNYVDQMLSNVELVKSKSAEGLASAQFNGLIDGLIQLSIKMLKVSLIAEPVLQVLKYLTLGLVFVYGSWLISKDLLSVGTLTIFLGASYQFFHSLGAIGGNYDLLHENLARMDVIFSILDTPPERLHYAEARLPMPVHTIAYRDLSFAYDTGLLVLRGISLNIVRGEVLGITGQSGSGKTTLIRLLARFYDPMQGEILLDGKPLSRYDLGGLRADMGIVFQDSLILNDTVRNNILYGSKDILEAQVMKAAEISCTTDFARSLPRGFDTVIGEGGKRLSGGEKQRLAIARAIVTEPHILVLDEGTSFLEVEQEKAIIERIKEERRDRITIIISHRPSAMERCDRVVTLDNGRLLDRG